MFVFFSFNPNYVVLRPNISAIHVHEIHSNTYQYLYAQQMTGTVGVHEREIPSNHGYEQQYL